MTHSAFLFVVYGLCVARLTRLVVADEITSSLRERLRKRATGEYVKRSIENPRVIVASEVRIHDNGWGLLWRVVSCNWCTSVWIGAGITALGILGGSWAIYPCTGAALMFVGGFLSERS